MDKNDKPKLTLIRTEDNPSQEQEQDHRQTAGQMLSENVRRLRQYAIEAIEIHAMGQGERYERVAQALGWAPNLGTLEELVQIVNELEKKKGLQ